MRSIYITSPEGGAGKSVVALGLVDLLSRRVRRVGVFRPVTRTTAEEDELVRLAAEHGSGDLDPASCVGVGTAEVRRNPEAALTTIIDRYRDVRAHSDVAVIIGSDYNDGVGTTELSYNAQVAANLSAPVLLVVGGWERAPRDIRQQVDVALEELADAHARPVGIVANRCHPDQLQAVYERLAPLGLPTWVLPEVPLLSAPTVADLVSALDGSLLYGNKALLEREAEHMLICGMNVEHILERLLDGQLCIAAGDRPDVLVALASSHAAGRARLAGIVLNGGFQPSEVVVDLVRSLDEHLPIVLTEHNTYETGRIVASTPGRLTNGTQRKIDTALGMFEQRFTTESVMALLEVPPSPVVTPLMFESMLLERARAAQRHIVLPEGDDDRILRAASTLLSRGAVELTLLGDETRIRSQAAALGVDIADARIIDPQSSELLDDFAAEYAKLRAHRGITIEPARDIMRGVSYFGTMMVHQGLADGMVSGAAHSTAHTITPAFEFIKTKPGTDVASSVFFMCLEDRVLVYGDCAVIPHPTVDQLADIAISAAATAEQFGIEPRIAMLSYSTGDSGAGADVERVRAATNLVRERRPDLLADGPLQYDAAVDASVAQAKLPGSEVAGRATVFVFPDLNTGNNTYKAVQRSAGAVAIGPILQGLARPVNDLSRGATVRDIVNTIAITAIQAASGEER